MQDDIKTFIKLKYEIITDDRDTWHLCETYPAAVKDAWAWRMVRDIEHLAKGNPLSENCIRLCKLYKAGKIRKEKMIKAWNINGENDGSQPCPGNAYYAAVLNNSTVTAYWCAGDNKEKWKLYISWLIEELCEYETTHAE